MSRKTINVVNTVSVLKNPAYGFETKLGNKKPFTRIRKETVYAQSSGLKLKP